MLEIRDLEASYGDTQVLRRISLDVAAGEVVTLIGRNGAGKSTTLRAIMGDLPRRSGSIRFRGEEIVASGPERICRLGIGYVPEDRGMFATLTVLENLTLAPPQNRQAWSLQRIFAPLSRPRCAGAPEGVLAFGGRAADAGDRTAALYGIELPAA